MTEMMQQIAEMVQPDKRLALCVNSNWEMEVQSLLAEQIRSAILAEREECAQEMDGMANPEHGIAFFRKRCFQRAAERIRARSHSAPQSPETALEPPAIAPAIVRPMPLE